MKALGVKSVINLRTTNDVWKEEQTVATAASMAYTNIPLHRMSAPTDAQVARVLTAISNMPAPVFVHCRLGRDRTGTIIACYRIRQDGGANSMALKEAKVYGISCYQIRMRNYVKRFKK